MGTTLNTHLRNNLKSLTDGLESWHDKNHTHDKRSVCAKTIQRRLWEQPDFILRNELCTTTAAPFGWPHLHRSLALPSTARHLHLRRLALSSCYQGLWVRLAGSTSLYACTSCAWHAKVTLIGALISNNFCRVWTRAMNFSVSWGFCHQPFTKFLITWWLKTFEFSWLFNPLVCTIYAILQQKRCFHAS